MPLNTRTALDGRRLVADGSHHEFLQAFQQWLSYTVGNYPDLYSDILPCDYKLMEIALQLAPAPLTGAFRGSTIDRLSYYQPECGYSVTTAGSWYLS